MKKIFSPLVYNILFSIIYFCIFSKALYRTGSIINIYYPGAIVIGVGIFLILNKKFWSLNHINLTIAILGLVIFIFLIPLILDVFWGSQLRNLYLMGYNNLFDIWSYYREVIK